MKKVAVGSDPNAADRNRGLKELVAIRMQSEYVPDGRSDPKVQRIIQYDKDHPR